MNGRTDGTDRLLSEPPHRLLLRLFVPATAALLVSSGCGILDAWFISRLGTAASGAVGIAFAVNALIRAIGYTLGTGSASIVSRALGAGDRDTADRFASLAFFLALLLGGAVTLTGLLLRDTLPRLLGASETVLPFALEYLRFLLPAAPLMCGAFVLEHLLRAEGQVKHAMLGTSVGEVVGAALDPLLLFCTPMGISGAALALLLAQTVSFSLLLFRYLFGKTRVSLRPRRPDRLPKRIGQLAVIGSPSLFRQGLAGVASALLLRQARRIGEKASAASAATAAAAAAAAAAAVAVNAKIFLVLYSFCLGVGQGLMPAAGCAIGADRPRRVLSLSRFALILATVLMLALSIPTALLALRLIALFRPDGEVVRIGALMLRAECAVLCFHGIIAVTNMLLQALGKALPAALIAASRQGLCFLPAVLLLPRVWGPTGLCFAQAVADALTLLVTLPFLVTTLRDLHRGTRTAPASNGSTGAVMSTDQ